MVGIAQYVMVICQRFDHLHYLLVTLTVASNVVCAHVNGDINDCIIDHKHYIIRICRMTVTASNEFTMYIIKLRGGKISDVDYALEQITVSRYAVTQLMRHCYVYIMAEGDRHVRQMIELSERTTCLHGANSNIRVSSASTVLLRFFGMCDRLQMGVCRP